MIDIKSNFGFVDPESHKYKYESVNSNYTHKILYSMLKEQEESLYLRSYSGSTIKFRYISELVIKYIYDSFVELRHRDTYNEETSFAKLISEWNKLENWKYFDLTKLLVDFKFINKDEKKLVDKYMQKTNDFAHVVDYKKISKKVNGKFINNRFSVEQISFKEFIKELKTIHKVLYVVFKIFITDICVSDFNDQIYDDGRMSLVDALKDDRFTSLLKRDCAFCEEGQISIPEGNKFEFGPYLSCNKCGATMSRGLNLKSNENSIACNEEGCKGGKIKTTVSYLEGSDMKKIKQCNLCKNIIED